MLYIYFFKFIFYLFTFLAASGLSCGTWDLSSLTRDRTCIPCIGMQILYHWTTREVLGLFQAKVQDEFLYQKAKKCSKTNGVDLKIINSNA